MSTCYNLVEIDSFKKAKEDEDPFECSQCEAEIGKLKLREVETYRMSPSKKRGEIGQNVICQQLVYLDFVNELF